MKKNLPLMIGSLFLGNAFFTAPLTAKTAPVSQASSLQYTLQDLQGKVFIRDKKNGKTEQAQEEQTVQSGDEVITGSGAKASLTLNKDTLFHLSENSSVKVDTLSRKRSGLGFISRLHLLAGKILSQVEQLNESRSTFEVSSGGVVCAVRGTAFAVETNGHFVQTNTFKGVVEVKKGAIKKNVEADKSEDFAFDQNTFLPKRTLTPREREGYFNWQKQKAVVERKLLERQTVLDSISNLTEEERSELLGKLDAYPEKDRLRMMRQLLQDWHRNNREKTLKKIQDDAAKKRKENDDLRKKQTP